jgi:transcriptional regulator with XRE-family HTH domain
MKTLAERLKEFKESKHLTWGEFAEKLGENESTLVAYGTGKRQPKGDFYKSFQKVFGYDIGQSADITGTNVPHETIQVDRETVYKNLVESNSEYSLVPKTVLNGEYRLMLSSEISDIRTMRDKALELQETTIKILEREIEELRERLKTTRAKHGN